MQRRLDTSGSSLSYVFPIDLQRLSHFSPSQSWRGIAAAGLIWACMTSIGHDDDDKNSIGIGLSKDFWVTHRMSDGAAARFENSPAGFRTLSTWPGDDIPTRVVFEATGAYHKSFERAFSGKTLLVKVNPLQVRRFAQACGTRVETDEVEAHMLASLGNALALEPDQPIDGKQFELNVLFSSSGVLIKAASV